MFDSFVYVVQDLSDEYKPLVAHIQKKYPEIFEKITFLPVADASSGSCAKFNTIYVGDINIEKQKLFFAGYKVYDEMKETFKDFFEWSMLHEAGHVHYQHSFKTMGIMAATASSSCSLFQKIN